MRNEPWLLVPEGRLVFGHEITLETEEARHASGSLRRKPGSRVVLADGSGSVAGAELIRCSRTDVVARVDEAVEPIPALPGPTVVLGVLHTKAMDWAIQKAVEVGVLSFVPLMCERSQGSMGRARARLEHWRRISLQALKQCHRAWRMQVDDPGTIEEIIGSQCEPGYVADQNSVVGYSMNPERSTLVVGPEGGFTSKELASFTAAGWSTVALGPHILRAETAAVVGAAFLSIGMSSDL